MWNAGVRFSLCYQKLVVRHCNMFQFTYHLYYNSNSGQWVENLGAQTNPLFFSFSPPSFNRLSPRSSARKNWSCANVTVAAADDDTTAAERGERNGSKRLEMFLQVIPLRFIAVRSNAGQRVESLHSAEVIILKVLLFLGSMSKIIDRTQPKTWTLIECNQERGASRYFVLGCVWPQNATKNAGKEIDDFQNNHCC